MGANTVSTPIILAIRKSVSASQPPILTVKSTPARKTTSFVLSISSRRIPSASIATLTPVTP